MHSLHESIYILRMTEILAPLYSCLIHFSPKQWLLLEQCDNQNTHFIKPLDSAVKDSSSNSPPRVGQLSQTSDYTFLEKTATKHENYMI